MARVHAETSNDVVIGIFTICSHEAFALRDLGSNYSYMSSQTALSILFWRGIRVPKRAICCLDSSGGVYYCGCDCDVLVQIKDTMVDLIVLPMVDLNVILCMNWLTSCHTTLDCHSQGFDVCYSKEPCVELPTARCGSSIPLKSTPVQRSN